MSINVSYVYVASSWRNIMQQAVVHVLHAASIDCYDFKDSEGFHWSEVGITPPVSFEQYMKGLQEERAKEGYARDMEALDKADCCVLVMPCGRSAHQELGYAVGQGKRTAILYETDVEFEPDLMHKMVDFQTDSLMDLLEWLGVED